MADARTCMEEATLATFNLDYQNDVR